MSKQQEHANHIVSPMVYAAVWLALLLGVALTIAASYVNLGILNPMLVLGIAFVQTALVVFFSMHLRGSNRLNKLSIIACGFVFVLLVAMVLLDYTSRAWGSW